MYSKYIEGKRKGKEREEEMETNFGNLFRKLRMEKGYTLREYCRKFQKDPSYISKIERSKLAPPIGKDDIAVLARSLDIEENSDDWKNFFMIAQISAKRIPEGEMTEEEVVKCLPVLLRTMTGEKLSEEKMNLLIEVIKSS